MYGTFVTPDFLASETELGNWIGGEAPANAKVLVRSATTLVLDASAGAFYDVDTTTGLATDPIIAKALGEATLIQAAAWAAIKYNPLTGGVNTGGVKRSKKIGSASFEMAGTEQAAESQAAAAKHLVPEACNKLRQHNLLMNAPYVA